MVLFRVYSKQMPVLKANFSQVVSRFDCLYTESLKLAFLAQGVCPFFLCKSLTDVLPAWMKHHAVTSEPPMCLAGCG